ncbi:MAG: MBL fold metallo-hydrolase [Telmatospirillum sp.]|nr:MBL fold metallo-hydrolase [Telmatospirillum sp.]
MQVFVLPVTAFAQNCSLIRDPETGRGAVIDPGGDIDRIIEAVRARGTDVEKILVTHGHIDHAGAAAELAEKLGVPIEGPEREDAFWIDGLPEQSRHFGFPPCRAFTPARWLSDGDTVTVGSQTLEVRHCPGHTPGHVVFFHSPSRIAFVGDVLFNGSIGRTDFPRGDYNTLITSITTRLWPMGDDVTFIPGHGPASTFGEERQSNPFVGDEVLKAGQ